jgi:EAL domain-containing protein (putative c-di-GMP-specific phosphodiesterase class I)
MGSPPEAPPPRRHPKRLSVTDLERYGLALEARTSSSPPAALLAIGLSRSDRVRALAQRPDTMRVLAEVLDRIEAALRPADRYSVVSVEEIWVMLASADAESIVRLAASALRERIEGRYDGQLDDGAPKSVCIEAAIGGAFVDEPMGGTHYLPLVANQALVAARSTEDRIAIHGVSTDTARTQRAQLEVRIRQALENNELEVWYQPQVRLDTQRCESFEALIRWPQPKGTQPVSPALIASICEESGMIGELTRFNVNTALRNLMTWQMSGPAPRVGINLSALTLADASFPSLVGQSCDTWGVAPSQLVFELTEGSIARNEKTTIEFMHRLHELGCGLSIDDFGTGYSSFSYLRHFPVDELKIDRAFVTHLATDLADRKIAKVLIEIAHTFGLQALAEGVEDAPTVAVLTELGCNAVQGWFYAKAMPADEAIAWVEAFNARSAHPAGRLETA